MKRNYILLLICVGVLGFFSCKKGTDLLDPVEVTDLNNQRTFSDSTLTMEFLTRSYAGMSFDWEYNKYTSTSTGNTDISDDGISSTQNGALHSVVTGTLSPALASPYRYAWETPWDNIRHLNVFLANADKTPMPPAIVTRIKAEARFLRAYYYSILVKYFGGVPMMGDILVDAEHMFEETRASYEESVNYIVSELDAAAADLPRDYASRANEYGRVTKGAALALKARVLLYAASPLFNGGNIGQELGGTPEQIAVAGYESYDENRWRLAQQAALDVINLGVYSLYEDPEASSNPPGYSFSRVFLKRKNSEYILQYNLPLNRYLEANFFAPSRKSTTRSMPTHNLASEFGMINGKRTDEAGSGYNPNDPFANRDPRFNYTIAYNGTMWYDGDSRTKKPVYTFVGSGVDGYDKVNHSTGYFWRKMQEENTAWNGGSSTERSLPLIRYAETLISYAEASNEIGEINEAYDVLILLRKRAGILPGDDGLYGLKPGMTKLQMREQIYHERRVEFAYEEQRFWDVRRWKIAERDYNGLQLTAMKITQKVNTNFTDFNYEVVPIDHVNSKLTFYKRFYLFPISQLERDKNNNLVQNPGY